MPNYAAKSDLINTTGVDTSDFAKKADSASLKSDVDELDINKLKNVPSGSDRLKSKVDKLNVDKLKPVPLDYVAKTKYAETEYFTTFDYQ